MRAQHTAALLAATSTGSGGAVRPLRPTAELAAAASAFYARRMRKRVLHASFVSGLVLLGPALATVRAQQAAPATVEPAPAQEAAPVAAAAPPAPPPPAQDGAYGGQAAATRPSKPAADGGYDDQGAAEADESSASSGQVHELSIRLDPFNWLLAGRLGVELEVGVWKWLSLELVPVFVTAGRPLAVNFADFDSTLTQHSHGIGPISGASLGAGFWLSGVPFSGYVLRLILTNYAYTYEASDGAGVFDRTHFTERRVVAFFGSHSRFGPFTLGGGFGLGYELNQQERCGLSYVTGASGAADHLEGRSTGCRGQMLLARDRTATSFANLNGPLHPFYLEARFSLGVVF